jgi:hypothetical protein
VLNQVFIILDVGFLNNVVGSRNKNNSIKTGDKSRSQVRLSKEEEAKLWAV